MMAPPGTTGAVRNSGGIARKLRWCYAVDMTGVNDVLQGIARQHSRYFKKAELPDTVDVERIVAKDALPLTRCVAVMLLMGHVDPEFVRMLIQLASIGRGEHGKSSHISSATCQAFVSSGLEPADRPVSPMPSASAAADAPSDPDDPAAPLDVDSFFASDREPSDMRYAEVARAASQHAAVVAKANRAIRLGKRKRSTRAPPALAPRPPPAKRASRLPSSPTAQRSSDDYAPADDVPYGDATPPTKEAGLPDLEVGAMLLGQAWSPPPPVRDPSPPGPA